MYPVGMKKSHADSGNPVLVAAVSGGPDSVYLLEKLIVSGNGKRVVVCHVNHGARGSDSERDRKFVKALGRKKGLETRIMKIDGKFPSGFEEKARDARYRFLKETASDFGGAKIAVGHTADDQTETILMRFLEGAGIAGLKGIPRETKDGIVRPIYDVWKEDILKYLKQNKKSFRIDRSNRDTRFERNWIRHVLVPLLVDRYGKQVKKRVFTLGERFRELDDYLECEADRWIRRNDRKASTGHSAAWTISRETYSVLPSLLRVKILQKTCFEKLGLTPNERLLESMDRSILTGKPSGRVKAGKGWELVNRYGEAGFVRSDAKGTAPAVGLRIEERRNVTPVQAKRIAARGNREAFDSERLRLPLRVRPLRYGDRILPFGQEAEKKLKEILIDRKVPREERWGRPAVCDSEGTILWIPGVIRSAHAPVTGDTRYAKILSYFE